MRRALLLVVVACLGLGACESTQDESARLKARGATAFKDAKGLSITGRARGVTVAQRAVITDPNGTAVAVVLRNAGGQPLPDVPIAIDVRSRRGKSVFRNNAPGLEPSLTSLALLPPGVESVWVNDQVTPAAPAREVRTEIGAPKSTRRISARLPDITLAKVQVKRDPVSGTEVTGRARLASGPDQRNLIIYCVGRRRGRIVAAGRSQIPLLTAKRPRSFHIFPIGSIAGADLSLSVPPTVL